MGEGMTIPAQRNCRGAAVETWNVNSFPDDSTSSPPSSPLTTFCTIWMQQLLVLCLFQKYFRKTRCHLKCRRREEGGEGEALHSYTGYHFPDSPWFPIPISLTAAEVLLHLIPSSSCSFRSLGAAPPLGHHNKRFDLPHCILKVLYKKNSSIDWKYRVCVFSFHFFVAGDNKSWHMVLYKLNATEGSSQPAEQRESLIGKLCHFLVFSSCLSIPTIDGHKQPKCSRYLFPSHVKINSSLFHCHAIRRWLWLRDDQHTQLPPGDWNQTGKHGHVLGNFVHWSCLCYWCYLLCCAEVEEQV